MTKKELLEKGQYIGTISGIVYNEYYLPNCKGKPVTEIGFTLSNEFVETTKLLTEEQILKIKNKAKKELKLL